MSDKDRAKCSMCGSEASYYSLYEKKQVALCSRNCQEKYNTKRANIPNILLIQLEDEEQNEEQDNNSEGEDSLFEACHRGEENNTILISSLESGQSPNQKNKQGQTLLTYSISKGDIRTLRILLSAGADVDEADDSSRTPLMVAANMGADKKMGLLLKRGANAMMQDAEGKTALHLTESNTTSDCAKLLLQYEPKLLNVKNNFDQTAAHLIAGAGNKAVQTILLDKGAQINGLDNLGRAPLHWAVLQKAETCVPLLLDHDDGHKAMDLPDRFGSCPIHYAIQLDNVDIVSMLTEKGCNVNIKDTTGRTALLLAAAQGSWDSCQRLAPKCDDINATDNEGFSALHHAAGNGESAICSLLIKHGADVNLRNKKEQTPMFPAVANAHVEVVHTLVEQGASCDAVKDVNGRNPAHYAAERGHKGIIRVILQYSEVCVGEGCDMCNPDENPIHFKDNEGHSALYLTAVNKHIDCLKILIKRGVFVDDEGYGLLVEMGLIDMVDENKRLTDKEEPDNSAEETPAEEVEESSDNKENEQENEKAEQYKQATPITAEGLQNVDIETPVLRSDEERSEEYSEPEPCQSEDEMMAGDLQNDVGNDTEVTDEKSDDSDEDQEYQDKVDGEAHEADFTDERESMDDETKGTAEVHENHEEESDDVDEVGYDGEGEESEGSTDEPEESEMEEEEDVIDEEEMMIGTEERDNYSNIDSKMDSERAAENAEVKEDINNNVTDSDSVNEEENNKVEEMIRTDSEEERSSSVKLDEQKVLEHHPVSEEKNSQSLDEIEKQTTQEDDQNEHSEIPFKDNQTELEGIHQVHKDSAIDVQEGTNIESVGVDNAEVENGEQFSDVFDNVEEDNKESDDETDSEDENNNYGHDPKEYEQIEKDSELMKSETTEKETIEDEIKNKTEPVDNSPIDDDDDDDDDTFFPDDTKVQKTQKPSQYITEIEFSQIQSCAAAWRKKYLDQKKRTISLEEKLNKLRSQLDLHHRRMLSQMERREDNTTLPKRVRDSQLTLTQQSYQNDLLKMKVEITEARVTSEAMLRNLLQKEMNGIRDLRTDYRNAHKTFSSKQQDTSRLLDAPDWLIRAKSQPSRLPQNGKWGKAVRKTAYLEQFKKAKDYERRHSNSTEKTENHSPKLSEGTKG